MKQKTFYLIFHYFFYFCPTNQLILLVLFVTKVYNQCDF